MKMKKISIALCVAFAAFQLNAQELTILHFNDTHSHIEAQRSGENKGRGGVIEHAAQIDAVRADEGKRNVLLLHAGDYGQGTSYFTELHGDMEIDVMNALKFDAACLGNHEFDNGAVELARRLKNLKTDVVCANYDFTGTPLEGLVEPFTIVRKAGMKIGIIGLLSDIKDDVDGDISKDFTYMEPAPIVNELAAYLKERKGCDMVICLSHMGFKEDCTMASQVRNVDVIVGGHSHTLLDDKKEVKDLDGKDVVIVQNWKWGLNMGRLTVDF